jgi:hypothetical protein
VPLLLAPLLTVVCWQEDAMKQLIGGIAGALVTGIAIFGWNGSTTRDDASFSMAETQRPLQLVSDHRGTPAAVMDGESAPAALNLTCEPGQRAVIRRMRSVDGTSMDAGCVGADDIATLSNVRAFAPVQSIQSARAVPVAYSSPRVQRTRSVPDDDYVPARRVEPRRSWQKRALVIGGSAGAGAGVGALAGGRKGALIGAAIGGGAGTLYEIVKH